MNKNKTDKSSQIAENMADKLTPERNKEFPEKKPAENEPYKNDPTRKDKLPLIISKL